ncbi:MAG: glutathione peroxidase [Sphingobacteriales bacterium]|nr:MAG: glutathione peroxidase [Sphingobacteriales bacterium]
MSLYSLSFTDSNGNTVAMSGFSGKKILFVNVASGSRYVAQLGELEQLRTAYSDSLVVIAFPSNSFAHEPLGDSAIRTLCETQYGAQYTIAQKGSVAGTGQQAVYSWLSQQSQNGVLNQAVQGDFQKFLVDGQGRIVAVFAPSVRPLDSVIQIAVAQRYP